MIHLKISFVTLFFILFAFMVKAQEEKNYARNESKKEKRIEIRTEKKELRKLEVSNVSENSLNRLNKDFGELNNVSWMRTDHYDEATFNLNNEKNTAYYDFDGQLVGKTTNKSFSALPVKVQNYITKKYGNYTVETVLLYDFNQVSDTYMMMNSAQFVDSKNYFVQLSNDKEEIVLQVNPVGQVFFFKKIR